VSSSLIVTDVETRVLPFSTGTWLDTRPVSTPLSSFPRFGRNRSSWRGPGADTIYVLVRTEDPAVFGVGQTRGGSVVERLVLDHLRGLLCGQDPREIGPRHEEMMRATMPYAAGGVAAMAVSAVELALWDLLARSLDVPLYRLLGGAPAAVAYYLTGELPTGDAGRDLGSARAFKIAVPCGPLDGPAGLQENLAALAAARSLVGPDLPLAVDCFMSWDVAYTVEFARCAAEFGLAWIEEPLPVAAIDEHAALRRLISPVRVAAGEHIFDSNVAYAYLEKAAVDILQVDVTWCGGLRVASALASAALARGVTFAPHLGGIQPWTLHFLTTLGPLGLAEVMTGVSAQVPVAGQLVPGDAAGVGIDPHEIGFVR
jgi:L-rhamnonate dehydratase